MSIKNDVKQLIGTQVQAIDNAREVDGKLIITPVNSSGGNPDQLAYEQVQIERRLEAVTDRGFVVQVIDVVGAGKRYEVERAPEKVNLRDLPLDQQLRIDSAMKPAGNDIIDLVMRSGDELPITVDLADAGGSLSNQATRLANRLAQRGWRVLVEHADGLGHLAKLRIEAAPTAVREVTENVVADLTSPATTSSSVDEYRANRERIAARNEATRKMQLEKAIAAKRAELEALEAKL